MIVVILFIWTPWGVSHRLLSKGTPSSLWEKVSKSNSFSCMYQQQGGKEYHLTFFFFCCFQAIQTSCCQSHIHAHTWWCYANSSGLTLCPSFTITAIKSLECGTPSENALPNEATSKASYSSNVNHKYFSFTPPHFPSPRKIRCCSVQVVYFSHKK